MILPALRELLSRHPNLADSDAEELRGALCSYLPRQPEVFEVETAMEALRVEGRMMA